MNDRKVRHMSHLFTTYSRPQPLSDAAVHIAPDLTAKGNIVRDTVDRAHRLDVTEPRGAMLANMATEHLKKSLR